MISMSIVYHFYFILSTIIHIIVEISSTDLQSFRYRSISLKGTLLIRIFIDNWFFDMYNVCCSRSVVFCILFLFGIDRFDLYNSGIPNNAAENYGDTASDVTPWNMAELFK